MNCRHKEKYLRTLIPGWSFICMRCKRINVDGTWCPQKETIERLVDYVHSLNVQLDEEIKEKEKLKNLLLVKKAKKSRK